MGLLQAALLGLMALIITPGYLFYFDVTPKVAVLLAGAGVALLLVRQVRPAARIFSLLLLLNGVSLGVSTALSANPALSAFGTNWRRFGAVPQLAVLLFAWLVAQHTAGRPDRMRTLLRAVAASGAIIALYGIAQYCGWDPLLPKAAYHIGEGIWTIVRPPGTMGYVSYFATWLLSVVFLGMALYTLETGAVWRKIALAAAALAAIAMLLTGTRAAVLGLMAGGVVWIYARGIRVTHVLSARRILAGFAAVLAVGVVFYFSPAGWQMRSRTRWFVEDPWGGPRPLLWRDSLRMAVSRPIAGYGPEVFTAAFARLESKAAAEAYPDFSYESAHNIFLDASIAQGLPGLLILCGLCLVGLRYARMSRAGAWLSAGVASVIVAQQFTVFIVPTATIFYTMIALAAGLAASDAEDGRWRWRFRMAAAPVAIALIYLAGRIVVADRELALARRSVESGNLAAGISRYGRYERWHLPGGSADLWFSRALLNLAANTTNPLARFEAVLQSAAMGRQATGTSEDPFNAWFSLAEVYAAQNDPAKMESSLRAAIAASPNWFKPHWALAQLLRMESRMDEAEREGALAAELNGGKHPEVARTLAEIREQRAAVRPPAQQR